MAKDFEYGEFWLPSDFLVNEITVEKKVCHQEEDDKVCFPGEFPYQFESYGSGTSSPVESLMGSAETESDEEDYIEGLTKQMVHSTLDEDDKHYSLFSEEKTKNVLAGSPQSPLCTPGCWKNRSQSSSCNSPTGLSQASSPTSEVDGAWEMLYSAAGQVSRINAIDEMKDAPVKGLLGFPAKPVSTAYFLNQSFVAQQPLNDQFNQVKQQRRHRAPAQWVRPVKCNFVTSQHLPNGPGRGRSGTGGMPNGRNWRPVNYGDSGWSAVNSQPCSGMRAVFLGDPNSKRECTGTGVFLPRRVGTNTDLKRKPACSTVLVPARVVQALNLNLDELGTPQPRYQTSPVQQDAYIGRSNNSTFVSQLQDRVNLLHSQASRNRQNQEISLPPEWTY